MGDAHAPRDDERMVDTRIDLALSPAMSIEALELESSALRARLVSLERRITELRGRPTGHRPAAPPPVPSTPLVTAAAPPTAPPVAPHSLRGPPPNDLPTGYAPERADAVERFVGTRVLAWLGAFVTLVAVAVFVKFAYDEGWLRNLGPLTRLLLSYAFAGLLLVLAEIFGRRFGRGAAIGLTSAGVGSLYAATAVGALLLEVLSGTAGVLVTAVVAVVALLFTLRSRSLIVGSVGLIGAYLTPVMIGSYLWARRGGPSEEILLGGHLTIVLGSALALSALRAHPFRAFRYGALVLHPIFAIPWIISVSPSIGLLFVGGWWAMLALECMLAAWRGTSAIGNVVATTIATAIASTVVAPSISSSLAPTDPFAYTPLVLALFAGIGTMLLRAPPPEDAIDSDERAIARSMGLLSRAFLFQALSLIPFGLAVFLSVGAIALAWSLSALLFVEAAWRSGPRGLRFLGFGALAAALIAAAVTLLESSGTTQYWPSEPWWSMRVGSIRLWIALWAPALVAAVAVIAFLRERAAQNPWSRAIIASITALAWSFLVSTATTGHLLVVLLALPAGLAFRWRHGRIPAMVLLFAAACTWASLVVSEGRAAQGPLLWIASILSMLVIGSTIVRGAIDETQRNRQTAFFVVATLWIIAAMGARTFRAGIFWETRENFALAADFTACAVALTGLILAFIAGESRAVVPLRTAAGAIVTAALGWIAVVAVGMRLEERAPQGMLGSDVLTGLALLAALILVFRILTRDREQGDGRAFLPRHLDQWEAVVAVAVSLVACWAVSILIIDLLAHGSQRLIQPALSAWWGLYGIGLVILGFRRDRAWLRWSGLAVLGLVFLKVLAIDLSAAGTIWRVLALLMVGLILVATSILYVRRDLAARPR